jgi:hypothetical protein
MRREVIMYDRRRPEPNDEDRARAVAERRMPDAVFPVAPARVGRWPGTGKTECGIHWEAAR